MYFLIIPPFNITYDVRLSGDIFLIECSRSVTGKDVIVENDEVLDEFVDQVLVDDLVPVCGDGHQCWTETDGEVVGIHHVLVAGNNKLNK